MTAIDLARAFSFWILRENLGVLGSLGSARKKLIVCVCVCVCVFGLCSVSIPRMR